MTVQGLRPAPAGQQGQEVQGKPYTVDLIPIA